jgi:hypothetical protein
MMRWCLVLEEFGPDLQYIKGTHNVVADALSRLPIDDDQDIFNISECFGYDDDDLPPSSFPLRYRDIAKAQQASPALLLKLENKSSYTETTSRGGNKQEHKLIWTGIMRYYVTLVKPEQKKLYDSISTGKVYAQW